MHWEVRAKLPLVLWMETETKEFEPALQMFSFVFCIFMLSVERPRFSFVKTCAKDA